MNDMIKTMNKLEEYHFHIPDYQRNYRWKAKEVTDLLNDIQTFPSSNEKNNRMYCLQPLIVKKQDNGYEVVDGQQRLTTMAIFMQIVKDMRPLCKSPFTLTYETREESGDFLKNIKESSTSAMAEANIDFYHMSHAYQTMMEWIHHQVNVSTNTDCTQVVDALYTKIMQQVCFIWYEVPPETNVIDLFNRVNMGKIPLTNADLIKALLLNKDNFDQHTLDYDQAEMSIAWERIEHGLANDAFWYFFNNKQRTSSRMNDLFGLFANDFVKNSQKYRDIFDDPSQLQEVIHKVKGLENNPLFSFYLCNEIIQAGQKEQPHKKEDKPRVRSVIKGLWQEIENLDALIHSWYDSPTYYHLVGLLITFDKPLYELVTMGLGQRKSQMVKNLLDTIKGEKIVTKFLEDEDISYQNTNRKDLRNLLLLFNIATLVTKGEQQVRFPFDLYKIYDWDIEHIHASADKSASEDDKVIPDNSLGNLTLLDKGTNRSYQNKPFKEKRAIILERDQAGLFIPVCTKNIFIKAYSPNHTDLDGWYGDAHEEPTDRNDKANYLTAMKDIIQKFFNTHPRRDH
ncbi:DUF262 domain-containing HNH endonuclease family protein (plasmid) [Entomospira nematocerorum]|uniref:DUF262 domain-containing protein n=1 Tax=Entomospira nematocerorum TaxID=2719987 RepID=A0A968GER6_9SPIO|nr:DUF262 domain-containing HNH endonuclease family protein [Entomospira nematocera]NIZ47727.1 DUF262 domain-containing protein [Entomospira nematocera]WDI34654.1 DUF262 domain-containing HNH endonuclease family protein [Entomospira nematocera]